MFFKLVEVLVENVNKGVVEKIVDNFVVIVNSYY